MLRKNISLMVVSHGSEESSQGGGNAGDERGYWHSGARNTADSALVPGLLSVRLSRNDNIHCRVTQTPARPVWICIQYTYSNSVCLCVGSEGC